MTRSAGGPMRCYRWLGSLLAAGVLAGCGMFSASSEGTTTASDTAQEASAIDNSSDIAIDSTFAYTFDADIDTATVTTDSLFLVLDTATDAVENDARKILNDQCQAASAIAATVSCATARRCVVTPARTLAFEATYRLCVAESVRYSTGAAFAGDSVGFSTAAPAADSLSDYAGDTTDFSDATYQPTTNAAIAAAWGDPRQQSSIESLLETYDALEIPNTIHATTIEFAVCPTTTTTATDARQILVPQQYVTIQKAVDAAQNYQTIVVDADTAFQENVRISGKYVNLVSSSESAQVDWAGSNAAKPVITTDCGGGALVRGFHLHSGSAGIKADTTTKGILTIYNNTIDDVSYGIMVHGGEVMLSTNDITANIDAVDLIKTKGQVYNNTLTVGGVGVVMKWPLGMKVWQNSWPLGAGQGAIFLEGGAAIVVENTMTMQHNGFGVVAQTDPAAAGNIWAFAGNTVTDAEASGIVVLGVDGVSTQVSVSVNTIAGTLAADDGKLEWMQYIVDTEHVNAFRSGMGVLVLDAQVQLQSNATTNNAHSGINYQRSCGYIDGNTSTGNAYGLVSITGTSVSGCNTPTLGTNTLANNGQNMNSDSALAVPPPPQLVLP